jgi:hypothetical protein
VATALPPANVENESTQPAVTSTDEAANVATSTVQAAVPEATAPRKADFVLIPRWAFVAHAEELRQLGIYEGMMVASSPGDKDHPTGPNQSPDIDGSTDPSNTQ